MTKILDTPELLAFFSKDQVYFFCEEVGQHEKHRDKDVFGILCIINNNVAFEIVL